MKLRYKILISVLFGLFAMALYSSPMWWGVFFSPLTQPLTTASSVEEAPGPSWEQDGVTVRLKSLDLLFSLFHIS